MADLIESLEERRLLSAHGSLAHVHPAAAHPHHQQHHFVLIVEVGTFAPEVHKPLPLFSRLVAMRTPRGSGLGQVEAFDFGQASTFGALFRPLGFGQVEPFGFGQAGTFAAMFEPSGFGQLATFSAPDGLVFGIAAES